MSDEIQTTMPVFGYRADKHWVWHNHLSSNYRKLITRRIDAAPENVRYQIGRSVSRQSQNPDYHGRRLVGVVQGGGVYVFKLLGWGKTPEAAEAMMKGEA